MRSYASQAKPSLEPSQPEASLEPKEPRVSPIKPQPPKASQAQQTSQPA